MKKVWTVCYQLPGITKTQSFDSFEEAKLFARRLISKHSEIPEYLDDVRDGRRKKYRAAIADFFEKYFKDPHFPYTDADIPSDNADDYKEEVPDGMIFGKDVDEDDFETDYDYDSPEEYFEEDEFESPISSDGMGAGDYNTIELPDFSTNLVLGLDEDEEYEYEEDALYLRITSKIRTGGRSNPVIILSRLKSGHGVTPKDFDCTDWDDEDEEEQMRGRTVYRHIKMLRDLGYIINKKERGFTLEGKTAPNNVKFGKSAYPIMILDVLENADKPLLQKGIIEEIKNTYHGTTIHRKAIGNIIDELRELGYNIEHTREGYIIQ